jgi:DNA-binding transcriptional ArsR family regulator
MKRANLNHAAEILKCIAHPVRLAIINLLGKNNELNVSAIQKKLDIEQAVVSHHLSKLRNANVLTFKREGKVINYKLKNKELINMLDCIEKSMK